MSGPIVRTGATPEFWENWDRIFGDKPKAKSSGKKASAGKKSPKKAVKKAPAKKAPAAKAKPKAAVKAKPKAAAKAKPKAAKKKK